VSRVRDDGFSWTRDQIIVIDSMNVDGIFIN